MGPEAGNQSFLPEYIEYGSVQAYCQPYDVRRTRQYGFLFEISAEDGSHAQELLDRCLNRPIGSSRYKLLAPLILLTFQEISIGSTVSPDKEKGYFTYNEASFWIPAVAGGERTVWFVPYMILDNGFAFACGREVYGFPKELGFVQIPEDYAKADLLNVDATVLSHFGPDMEACRKRLLQVSRVSERQPHRSFHTFFDLLRTLCEMVRLQPSMLFTGLELSLGITDVLPDMGMVFLKQFRDAADGKRCCYQEIIECSARLRGLKEHTMLTGDYELTIEPADSHPICSELGLKPQQRAAAAFYVEYAMTIEAGTEIRRKP